MKDEKIPAALLNASKDPFNKILILRYPDEYVVCFFTSKSEFEKVKSELEKYGEVIINTDFETHVAVEVHTDSKEKVGKILKVLRNIKLEDLGIDGSVIRDYLNRKYGDKKD